MAADELVFAGENPDEKIVFVLRRHPWTLMPTGLGVVGLLLVVTAAVFLFGASRITSLTVFIIVPTILYLIGRAWFVWANSVYVLTNERLLAVDQRGWFTRTVVEVALTNIMAISHDVKGAMATLLNFGDITIQASGATEKDMTLTMVYDPYEVQQRIVRAQRGGPKVNTSDAVHREHLRGGIPASPAGGRSPRR